MFIPSCSKETNSSSSRSGSNMASVWQTWWYGLVSCSGKNLFDATEDGDAARIAFYLRLRPSLVDARDSRGWTPLMWALLKGHSAVVHILCRNGADLYARIPNDENGTVGHWAAERGHDRVLQDWVQLVLQESQQLQHPSVTPSTGIIAQEEDGSDYHGVNVADGRGETMLHRAVRRGRQGVVRYLVEEAGANFTEVVDATSQTPLQAAERRMHPGMLHYLQGQQEQQQRTATTIAATSLLTNLRAINPVMARLAESFPTKSAWEQEIQQLDKVVAQGSSSRAVTSLELQAAIAAQERRTLLEQLWIHCILYWLDNQTQPVTIQQLEEEREALCTKITLEKDLKRRVPLVRCREVLDERISRAMEKAANSEAYPESNEDDDRHTNDFHQDTQRGTKEMVESSDVVYLQNEAEDIMQEGGRSYQEGSEESMQMIQSDIAKIDLTLNQSKWQDESVDGLSTAERAQAMVYGNEATTKIDQITKESPSDGEEGGEASEEKLDLAQVVPSPDEEKAEIGATSEKTEDALAPIA